MYHFVENSIRGGISMISTRHARANSPSFPSTYNASPGKISSPWMLTICMVGQCLNRCQHMGFVGDFGYIL